MKEHAWKIKTAVCFLALIMAAAVGHAKSWISIGTQEITSFNAVREQCDADPDNGAYGRVAKNGIPLGNYFASNFLAPGTRITIPALTGENIWICRDRLNPKVWWRIDLLYPIGRTLGKRRTEVFVLNANNRD